MCGAPIDPTMTVERVFTQEASMPFIQIKVVEGVFTAHQKREIVERVTEALVEIAGEGMRQLTWCVVEEIPSGEWGIGGQSITADDVRAIARAWAGEP
jgi:4-oxalocrotonate tautomerase